MKNRITIEEFSRKHPELAKAAKELIEARSVTPDKDGRFSESLLETAAQVKRDGGVKSGRYCAMIK